MKEEVSIDTCRRDREEGGGGQRDRRASEDSTDSIIYRLQGWTVYRGLYRQSIPSLLSLYSPRVVNIPNP